MKLKRIKILKTGFPSGARVKVIVTQSKDFVRISTERKFDFLTSAPDNDFGCSLVNGQLFIKCNYDEYAKVIFKFNSIGDTKYQIRVRIYKGK